MKRYLIGFGILILCISSYFIYDIAHANILRGELTKNLDQSNLEFIKENKQALLKYSEIQFKDHRLQTTYNKNFNEETWPVAKIIEATEEYQLLFGELPLVESQGIQLPANTYVMEYLSEKLLGKEMIALNIINSEDLEKLSDLVGFTSPYELFKEYYSMILKKYFDGHLANETIIELQDQLEDIAAFLGTTPSHFFKDATPELLQQYTSYNSFELIRERILSLENHIKEDPSQTEFYEALQSLTSLLEAEKTPDYTVDQLQFESTPESNTFIIPSEVVTQIRAYDYDEKTATKEFTNYLTEEFKVNQMTLESNKIYYIVSTNDYYHLDQIEIVYTFDHDYGQFVYANDCEEALESHLQESGLDLSFYDKYNISFFNDSSEEELLKYNQAINQVLSGYDKILLPILITNQIYHYYMIEEGHFYTQLDMMFMNSSKSNEKHSDLSIYIVENLSSGFMNYNGLSSDQGIIFIKEILSLENDNRNTIHHELMHHIQRYYGGRYLIKITLDHTGYQYLDNQRLSKMDYYKTKKFKSFSIYNVLNRMDYGMTSLYGGTNYKEHLAEFWSDLLIDYDLYKDEIDKHPVFKENVDKLITYMNEILVTVGDEPLEGVDDILRFDTLSSTTKEEKFNQLAFNLNASDFKGSMVEIYPAEIYSRYNEIKNQINNHIKEQFDWYYDYSNTYSAVELPYHENFGVTEEAYNFYNSIDNYEGFEEVKGINGSFKDLGEGKLLLECEGLEHLNGLLFDLNRNVITAEYGEFVYDFKIEPSDQQAYSGFWNGGGWACIFDQIPIIEPYEKGKTYGEYSISIGRFEASGDLILWFKQDTFKDGIEQTSYEIAVIQSN
ncbi:MAG: hypothetical protein JXR88_04240 [Clostridia bacterium]|nr:hypothetical protein [Clostridia bacterium]